MEQEILDIYGREETFLEQVAHDLDNGAVWFNPEEFGRFHDIDGSRILSVFAGDSRTQKLNIRLGSSENPEGVYKSHGVLFVRAQEIEAVNANQPMRLDGRLYTVVEARLLQDQVWRIVLEANES